MLDELSSFQKQSFKTALGQRSIALVGLMGVGKTTIGRHLATLLDLPFVDSDHEIEMAAGSTIEDIFLEHGEDYFRQGEQKVMARLLQQGPQILATGGGAFIAPKTRTLIQAFGLSVWIKVPLPILLHRLQNKKNRPLLQGGDLESVLTTLMQIRYPVYSEANITIEGANLNPTEITPMIVRLIASHLGLFLFEKRFLS